MSESGERKPIAQRLRGAARVSGKLIVICTAVVIILTWLGWSYISPEARAGLLVAILGTILILGPGHFVVTALGILWMGFWVPLKVSVVWMANNWEATVVLIVQLLVWAGRQKWTIFLAVLGVTFANIAVKFTEPLAAYVALASAVALVLYRFIDQFKAHLSWNSVLEEVAEAIENNAKKPKVKPKLKRNVVLGDELEDAQFGTVAAELASYLLLESIIAKLKRQYLKLTMHILAMVSLVYSVTIIYLAACIGVVSVYISVSVSELPASWTEVANSLLRDAFFLEKSPDPLASTIATLLRLMVALQVVLFFRTIFETTKAAIDQFLKRLERSLSEVQGRKAAEITFVFGRTPEELGAALKKRGEHFGKIINAVRSGQTSEALNLLESSRKSKKDAKALSHDAG